MTDAAPEARKETRRPFEEAEAALVRSVVSTHPWLSDADEATLRYALNLARVETVRAPGGADVDLGPALAELRDDVRAALPAFQGGLDRAALVRLVPVLRGRALAARGRALLAAGGRLPPAALDREVTEKALVVVCGGGGGVAWSYLGAFQLLERYGLAPRLLAGTSMGAALALFRAHRQRWHTHEVDEVLAQLSFRGLFRFLQVDSRYGLPAALRLYLRSAIGPFLRLPDGRSPMLGELAIPLVVTVTGVRNGALPRDPSYYEHLLDAAAGGPSPQASEEEPPASFVGRTIAAVFEEVGELFAQRDRLVRLHLGADEATREFDAIDAVGFSSALPGVIHYDVLRDDERMHRLLEDLFRREDLFRLVDGGLVDNLPARAAWEMVQRGAVGSRNAFVLALEGFAPRLTQPLWYGLQQLAAVNVAWNLPFVDLHVPFQRVLSPSDVVPAADDLRRAVNDGKTEFHPELPFLARMVRPFPALEAVPGAR